MLPDQLLTEEQWQHCDSEHGIRCFLTEGNNLERDDEIFIALPSPEEALWRTTQSTELAMQESLKKEVKTLEQLVPEQYLEYHRVFEEETSWALPLFRKWDHGIELKLDAIPSNNCKIYPLNVEEQKALDVFLKDMLDRGYIQESQSPLLLPSS